MSTVILARDKTVEVRCGGKLFTLCEGDDGTLYIEAADSRHLEVTISDDGDDQVTAHGMWANIGLAPVEEGGD
jgi:hypothetical protein